MSGPLFSASWHRVRDLKPRLRSHARIHRHRYRGETWYVLQDPSKERFHRFPPAAERVIALLDGRRSVDEVWQLASEQLGDDAPTQDELIELLGRLHAADVLQTDVSPDAVEIFERGQQQRQRKLRGKLLSPFAIQIPLVDPERFLAATGRFVRPLFGPLGAVLWLAVVIPALVGVGVHWSELTEGVLDRLFTPQSLLVLWLLFPVLKAIHELGHGYAVNAFGGQVHDMGVMLLVFAPVPYVDASSSWAFQSKWQRAVVGAGGVIAELFVAALAFYVWVAAEPGVVRAAAYNALLISGATTLLFNLNPLLKFDGYYVLADVLEIPNLRARATEMVRHLTERHLFGAREAPRPRTARGETGWLVGYAVASFAYRMLIVAAIALWLMDQFFLAGLLLGAFALTGWVLVPLFKGMRHLLRGPALARVRGRAIAFSAAAAVAVVALLGGLPLPHRTGAEGVVWVPEEAFVRAPEAGFVEQVVAEPGAQVAPGDPLFLLRDPILEAEATALAARVRELEAQRTKLEIEDRGAAELVREELLVERRALTRLRERLAALRVVSRVAGSFVLPRAEHLRGQFVAQGTLLGHVVDLERLRVRAVVPQETLELVRSRQGPVQVRLAQQLDEVHDATLLRIVPGASERLPSVALGSAGGGSVPVDPRDARGDRAVQSHFQVELELPLAGAVVNAGGRAYVRFDHGREPLGAQWYRRLRQLFLSRLHV